MSFKIIRVGRAKDNDIVLSDSSVSRNHCEFSYDSEGNVFLFDKNSTNGTFVNGHKIKGYVKLELNDVVVVGIAAPLRWKEFSKFSQSNANIDGVYKKGNINNASHQSEAYSIQKKRNKAIITIITIVSISALFVVLGFLAKEYFAEDGDIKSLNEPNEPKDKTNKTDQNNKKTDITYDFSCLNDKNDLGTTDFIDGLEKIDKEVTNTLGGEITIQEEENVGDQLLADCKNQYTFIESGEKYANLKSILAQLTTQILKPKGFQYQIFLIESNELNAFTAGGKIFVTTKMYSFCQTNDELACIIGHEINHNELGHIKEYLQKERVITTEGADLASILTISFGQKKEIHCDMTGIDLVIAAGYNGCVNIKLWERMQKELQEGDYNVLENLFRSHPYSEKRAKCSYNHILTNYKRDCYR